MIESRVEVVRHFLSKSGIAQGGNLDLYADAWRDKLTVETAYSISPDSPPVFVDPATIEIVSDDELNVFSDVQRVVLPMPGLQTGSNATVAGTRRFQSADFPLAWSWILTLGSIVPIARIEVSVTREAGAPDFTWASNDPDLECREVRGRSLDCTRSKLPAVALDPSVLSYADLIPHLYVGIPETWKGLESKVRALVERSATLTPSLRAKVDQLQIDPTEPRRDKLWKLLRFVADEIRYVSLSHGDSTVVPHPASLTLSRRYGDCKDKVTVLVAMARVVGLDLVPVLTSSGRKDRQGVLKPSSGYFDHMIACMDTELGERVCVDPTQAYSGLELPPQLSRAISLPLGAEGEASLGNLGAQEFGWNVHLQRELNLERDASLSIRDVRRFAGPGAAANRSDILALSSADRDAWLKREYKEVNGTAATPTFQVRSLRDASVPYEIESTTSVPGGHQRDTTEYFGFDPWLVYYAHGMISTNQHHPYELLGLRYSAEETITQCCGRLAHFAPTLDFESKYGSLRRTAAKVDGRLIVRTVLELPAAVIPPAEVPRLESFIMQAISESGLWFSWHPED